MGTKILTLILFLLGISTSIDVQAQTENITKQIKAYNSDSEIKIVGAALDTTETIHITIKLNDLSTKWVEALNGMFGKTIPAPEIRTEKVLNYFYKAVRRVVKKFPKADRIKLYVATFTTERDKYGNESGENKTIDAVFVIRKATVEKLNWKYVNELLNKSGSRTELLGFLDSYKFYTAEFE